MNNKTHGLPKARVEKSYFTWLLWLVPFAAACLCGWFVFQDLVLSGPTITIYFQNADGLQAQNSPVKYRGIKIGEVEALTLSDDRQHVAVRVKLDRSATDTARQDSKFWIVRPQVKLGDISGLRTIVSGNYITVEPGDGVRTNVFTGLEQPPVEPVKGINLILLTHDLGSLQKQSPVFYEGIQVGEVLDCHFSDDASAVVIRARIRQEYSPLVRVDSKFWNAGGINVHAGLFSGVNVSAESMQTVVSGGIAFTTPPDYGPAATNGTAFPLNDKEDDDWKNWHAVIPLKNVPDANTPKSTLPKLD